MKVQQNRWAINPMAYTVYTYHKTLQWLMNAIPAMQWLILASSSGEKPAPECRNTLQWLAKRCYHAPIAAHDLLPLAQYCTTIDGNIESFHTFNMKTKRYLHFRPKRQM